MRNDLNTPPSADANQRPIFDPDNRLSIYEFQLKNEPALLTQLCAKEPNFTRDQIKEVLDDIVDKSFQPKTAANPIGFDHTGYDNPDAGLYDHLFSRTLSQMRTPIRRRRFHSEVDPAALSEIAASPVDVAAEVEQRQMLESWGNQDPALVAYAAERYDGKTEAEFTASGTSNNRRNKFHGLMREFRAEWAGVGPIAAISLLLRGGRGGGAGAAAAAGGGAAAGGAGGVAASAGVGALVTKGAICVAGVLCLVGGGVAIQKHDSKPDHARRPAAAVVAPARKLYTPIAPHKSSSSQSTTKAKSSAAKRNAARKRDAAQRETRTADSEFGVEAGQGTSSSSSSSGSSSSGGSSRGSSNHQEFGVEAGE